MDLKETKLSKIAETIQDIRMAYPTTKNAFLQFAGKDDHPTGSPFKLRFKNGIRENIADLEYISGNNSISIELPISFYSDDVKGVFMRSVTDCEYHYFGGVSMDKIRKMQIRCYKSELFQTAKYFGGDCVTFIEDDSTIDEKQEFETFVLNGHVPEFVAFWTSQLIEKDKA